MLNPLYRTHKETIHNFLWRAVQTFGKQGVTFLIFLFCARLLSTYEFGIYNYALAIIFFLVIFGDFGISSATSKYVAEYNATDKEKLKHILFNSGLIILGLTIIITIIAVIIGPIYLKDKYVYVLYLLPLIFLAPMTSLYDGIYCGLKKFKQLALISVIVGLISLSFVYILVKQYGLIGALIAQNLFYILLLLGLFIGYREIHFKFNKELIKKIGSYSLILGISNIGLFFYAQIGTIILGQFSYINEIGYYEMINKIFNILFYPTILLATVIAPNTTRDFALKKYKELRNKMLRQAFYLFIMGLIIAIASYFIFPILFQRFLPQYDIKLLTLTLDLLLILIPLKYFSTFLSIGYITPTGNLKFASILIVIMGFSNVLLGIFSIKTFGFIGIIYATLICQILYIIIKDTHYYILLKNISDKENDKKN